MTMTGDTPVTEGTPLASATDIAGLTPGGTPGQIQATGVEAQQLQTTDTAEGAAASGQAPGETLVDIIQKQYPEWAWLLYTPLANTLIDMAVRGVSPTDSSFLPELEANPWWNQLNSNVQSTLLTISQQGIGQFTTALQAQENNTKLQFQKLGLQPDQNQINAFAYQALFNKWTDTQIMEHIRNTVQYNPDGTISLALYHQDPTTGKPVDAFSGRQAFYGPQGQPGTPDEATAQKLWGSNYQAYQMPDGGGTVFYSLQPGAAPQGTGQPGQAGPMGGDVEANLQQLTALAKNNLITVAPQKLSELATGIASGTYDFAYAQSYITNMAMSKWANNPDVVAAIQRGESVQQYFNPYVNEWANELSLSPDSINLNDSKWGNLLQTVDPASGQITQNTIAQSLQKLRSDPVYGYQNSPNARTSAYNLVQSLGEDWGLLPPGGTTPSLNLPSTI